MGLTFNLGRDSAALTSDASLNVGIGGSPSGSYKLEVTGTAKVSSTLLVSGAATFSSSVAGVTGNFTNSTSGNTFIIGTTYAGGRNIQIGISDGSILPTAAAYINDNTGVGVYIGDNSAATKGLYVKNGGNVGIGTSSPANLLHLAGTSATPSLRLSSSANIAFYWDIGRENASTGDFVFNNAVGGAATERMRITSGGVVSIGTTNTTRNLNVIHSIGVRTNRTGTEQEIFFIGATGSGVNDGYLGLSDNGTRKVQIVANNSRGGDTYFNGGGNVGIGTDTPSYKLHVNGTAYATGAAGALSDIRHKNNILNINAGLDAVMLLRPVSYLWNEELITDNGMQGLHFGFIAQEVKEVLPDVILEQNDEEKTLGLKYNEIIPLLVKAIQEQNQLITSLQDRLDKLENK